MSEGEIVMGGLTAAGTSSYSTEPTSASEARGKIRASTSATRQLRSDPGAVDRFGDAIEREPVLAEVERFRDSVRHDRLYACWLLSCYGLRRSEVLGLRWSALDGDTLLIRRGRVTVGKESDEGMPKSRRSRRDLPLPAELSSAL